ncbi:hypothetical protein BG011_007944 [Mortierella polycephala]|uniref:Uncharacterized protein n=1 Tax=Mortierella polycephala TaxID=41804 RepID=A0A9P6PQW5_9FUNG|nr:hypothetical protein BG011_007944 [Mortierella polycephala]
MPRPASLAPLHLTQSIHRKHSQKAWGHDTVNRGYRDRSTYPTPSIHRQGREQRQHIYAARVESEEEVETEFAEESASEQENESASNVNSEFNLISMDPSESRWPTSSQSESEPASISPPEPESETETDSSTNDYSEDDEDDEYDRDDDDDDDPDDPAYSDMPSSVQALRNESVQRLAAAWNDIFERYGKEPSELPPDDEIDLGTGELIVDNGVLRSQETTLFGALTSLGKELKEPLKLERIRHRARIHRTMHARIPGTSNIMNSHNTSDAIFPLFNSKSGTQVHLLSKREQDEVALEKSKKEQNGYDASSLDDKPERYRGDDFDNLLLMSMESQASNQQPSFRHQQEERMKWLTSNAHGSDDYESEDGPEEETSVEDDQENSDDDAEHVSERNGAAEEEQAGRDEEPAYNLYDSESDEEEDDDEQDSWEDEQENTVRGIVDDPDVTDFEDGPDLETDTRGDSHLVDSSDNDDDDNEDKEDRSQYSYDSVDSSNPFVVQTSQSGATTRPVLRDTQPIVGSENMAHSKAIWRSLDIHHSPTSWTKVSTYRLFPRGQRTERKESTHTAIQDEVDREHDDVAKDMRRISPPVTSLSPMAARFHTALSFNVTPPRQQPSHQRMPCQQHSRQQPPATPRTMTARARALADSLLSGKDTPQITSRTPYAASTPSLTPSASPPYSPVSKKRRRTSPEPEMRPVQRLNTGQGFLDFDPVDLFRDDPFFETSINPFAHHDPFEVHDQSSPQRTK